jgi:hypothetical protein
MLNASIARQPIVAARPPGAGPHSALNLDNLWLSDFCAPGYSPSQRRANVYKVQVNLVEKSSVFPIPL